MNKYASLTPPVLAILEEQHTEPAFSGRFIERVVNGSYLCRGCGLVLFRADNQFTSHCGWPSFDDQLPNTVTERPDADGRRTEIICARCQGHLGHVFRGEKQTAKNLRHCVNSLAIEFVADTAVTDSEEIIIAAGCFWGVEYWLKRLPGVLKTEVGYCGGTVPNPTYEQVCEKNTGHYEAVRVVYDPQRLTLTRVLERFFAIHNFEQSDGQGPDIGPQYRSAIFCHDDDQKAIAENVINKLKQAGQPVSTVILPASVFWSAENYHQEYYEKTGKEPYCHRLKNLTIEESL